MAGSITIERFEEAALLKIHGFQFMGAELNGGRKVALRFEDPEGKGDELLTRHNMNGIEVNSLAFEDALRWSRDRVFAARGRGR